MGARVRLEVLPAHLDADPLDVGARVPDLDDRPDVLPRRGLADAAVADDLGVRVRPDLLDRHLRVAQGALRADGHELRRERRGVRGRGDREHEGDEARDERQQGDGLAVPARVRGLLVPGRSRVAVPRVALHRPAGWHLVLVALAG